MLHKLHFTHLVFLLSSVISTTAIYISYKTGWMLAYNDAAAHLNTARRMVDNLTPGFVQIGSVWLPLLHILELPFVLNYTLWQTGLAGAIVSSLSFIIGAVFLFKLLMYVTENRWTSLLSVLVFITNLNFLYLQTTAMFEPLLIALALGSVYFFTKWAREFVLRDLVLAALFTMLATLTRYDGWALFLASSAFVLSYTLLIKKKIQEGPLIVFVFLAGFGIILWLIYNGLIFGDPLYFANSEFSAKAQQDILESRDTLQTKHNLPISVATYTIAVLINNGIIMFTLFIAGLLVYLRRIPRRPYYLAPMLLLVPYLFNIVSLYIGQSVIWLPMIKPFFETYFNARYGILLLPAVAFFVGIFASYSSIAKHFVLYAVVLQAVLFLHPSILPVFGNEGIITLRDTVSSVNSQTKAASQFLHDNHTGGLILVSSASADAFIFRTGIPLKNFITEGTGHYWREAVAEPAQHATWLVFFQDHTDRVGRAMKRYKRLEKNYQKVYEDQTYQIWKRQD